MVIEGQRKSTLPEIPIKYHIMNANLRHQERTQLPFVFTKAIIFLLVITTSWFVSAASGQTDNYYEYNNYVPAQPYKFGKLGTLFNSAPHLIQNAQTAYNGLQDVYATAYLPFAEQEYDASYSLELYGLHYTTAIALCSPKNPLMKLYAPVQVKAIQDDSPATLLNSALASSIPIGSLPFNFKGPFNELPTLN
jgi:hypothetical protein